MLIKYSQNYDFYIFYFVSLEVGTAALKIFCVMIPSLVYTSLDFGLFRVVRPQQWRMMMEWVGMLTWKLACFMPCEDINQSVIKYTNNHRINVAVNLYCDVMVSFLNHYKGLFRVLSPTATPRHATRVIDRYIQTSHFDVFFVFFSGFI